MSENTTQTNWVVILTVLLLVGMVTAVGAWLAFVFSRMERGTAVTKNSESYQAHTTTLAQPAAAQMQQLRAGRTTDGIPVHQRPRWSTFSTAAIVILFAIVTGMLLNSTFWPDSEMMVNGRTASAIPAILLWLALISAFIIIWRNRAAKAQTADGGW